MDMIKGIIAIVGIGTVWDCQRKTVAFWRKKIIGFVKTSAETAAVAEAPGGRGGFRDQ